MPSKRKEIQDILLSYGNVGKIIKKNTASVIADFAVSQLIDLISKRYYKPRGVCYGLSEAIFQKPIDQFERYASVVREIKKIGQNKLLVLDVGAGGKGVSSFEGLLMEKECTFVLFDIKKNVLVNLKNAVMGDGCKLPFKTKVFDVVVSVDAVEHIPKPLRNRLYKELTRICKKKIIITCPLQSEDGTFQGRNFDILFQYSYEHEHKSKEPNTEEHIASNHPTKEEICEAFPGASIHGYKNCNVWLKYMSFSCRPLLRLFSGLFYYFFWRKNSNRRPYWGAVITLDLEPPSDLAAIRLNH